MSDLPDKAARVIEGETAYCAAPRRMRGMRASSGRRFQDSALACTDLVLKMRIVRRLSDFRTPPDAAIAGRYSSGQRRSNGAAEPPSP